MAMRKDVVTFFGDKKNSPPLKCSCGVLNIIVKTTGVILDQGNVMEAHIVAISEWDTAVIDPTTSKLRYQYDYTLEYSDALLVDITRPIRGCDIEISCCESCTSKFLKGRLRTKVSTVTGNIVNNSDPLNPVVLERITTMVRAGTPTSNDISYVSEVGVVTTFAEGLTQVVAPVPCRGIGPGQAIEQMQISGTQLIVQSAAVPQYVQDGSVGSFQGPLPSDLTAIGDYDLFEIAFTLTNPSSCLPLRGTFFPAAEVIVGPISPAVIMDLAWSFTMDPAPDLFLPKDVIQNGAVPNTGLDRVTLQRMDAVFLTEFIGSGIPAGQSRIFRLKVRVRNLGAGTGGSSLINAFGGLRFMGMTS